MTQSQGVPSSENIRKAGPFSWRITAARSSRSTNLRSWRNDKRIPEADCSRAGAITTTGKPRTCRASMSRIKPGASIPSSLVRNSAGLFTTQPQATHTSNGLLFRVLLKGNQNQPRDHSSTTQKRPSTGYHIDSQHPSDEGANDRFHDQNHRDEQRWKPA